MAWVDIQNGESGSSVRGKINGLGQTALVSGARLQRTEIGRFTTTSTQSPTGTGSAGKIRVNFGAGGNTSGNEFTVAADGTITSNVAAIQYIFTAVIRISRSGAPGTAIIMARALYSADGTETDTVQLGGTFSVRIDDSNTVWREEFELPLAPASGSHTWLELARDAAGNNDGDLGADQPTGTLLTDTPAWNPVSSAALLIEAATAV